MTRQKFSNYFFRGSTRRSAGSFWHNPSAANYTFRARSLGSMAKVGIYGTLTACTLLYGWDQYEQHKSRVIFNTTKPKGQATLKSTTSVQSDELDDYEFSEDQTLTEYYGKGAMVKVGGGRKEGFRGIIPLPEFLEPSDEVRSSPLDKSAIAHVGIVVEPVEGENNRPLIIGRQSPSGPLPTLMSAIHAGWSQSINPIEGETISSVMEKALQTTVANEAPHISKGTSFDTRVIEDLAIPVEFVDEAIKKAETDLNPVMTFAWDNCMTTKSYTLLQLAKQVDQWASSGQENAPSRKEADAFITGCYDIIDEDIHARGYGVLNNSKIAQELVEFGEITRKIGRNIEKPDVSHFEPPL